MGHNGDAVAELRKLPLVFVSSLETCELEIEDHEHLAKSLRVRPGDQVALSDGCGSWRKAEFADNLAANNAGETVQLVRPKSLKIAFSIAKGNQPELVVQKLTELGVDHIMPIETERSVVRWAEKSKSKKVERLRRISRQAAMQSKNCFLPTVEMPTTFAATVRTYPAAVLCDPNGRRLQSADSTLVIGPEGGFSENELATREAVCLPGNILRAETAAIVAGALMVDLRLR